MTPEQPAAYGQGYVFDQESASERARLVLLDRMINETMGGPLAEQKREQIQRLQCVLDIGCGPGGWALDLARTYGHLQVIGIDNSTTMIAQAREEKSFHDLDNIEFEEMDALQSLRFADGRFDLVNIRNAVGYIPRQHWPKLLTECYRITRAQGILRLTEGDGMGLTNSVAYEGYHRLAMQAMRHFGYGFSPDGATLGITPMLSFLVKQAGYTEEVGMQSHFLDFSYGTQLYSSQRQNIELAFTALPPLLMQSGVATQEEIETLYHQALEQLGAEDFRGMGYLLTVWGKKP